jgi:sec-independent protein translocase protein TatC
VKYQHSEDLFADTRMSFGEHLEELRTHLLRALYGFLLGMIACFFIGDAVVEYIKAPVETALGDYHIEYFKRNRQQGQRLLDRLHAELKKENPDPHVQELNQWTDLPVALPRTELDALFRQLYPELFAKSGSLEHAKPPAADAPPLTFTSKIKPIVFLERFQDPLILVTKRLSLTTLSAQESFMVYFQVSIITGFVISSPWVIYQIWAFVAAGLYPHEKKYVYRILPFSIFLFLAGVLICEMYVMPAALDALLYFNRMMNLEPDFRLSEWLSFAILMPLVFGLSFQMPLVMLFLGRVGIFSAEDFASKRRISMFVMVIFAAVVTPSIDPVSLLVLWIPLVALYEVGIQLVRYTTPPEEPDNYEVPYTPEETSASSGDSYRE